jgi:hypothetical protein
MVFMASPFAPTCLVSARQTSGLPIRVLDSARVSRAPACEAAITPRARSVIRCLESLVKPGDCMSLIVRDSGRKGAPGARRRDRHRGER